MAVTVLLYINPILTPPPWYILVGVNKFVSVTSCVKPTVTLAALALGLSILFPSSTTSNVFFSHSEDTLTVLLHSPFFTGDSAIQLCLSVLVVILYKAGE